MADIFQYGDTEINYLAKKDKKLGAAIARIGKISREVTPEPFTALIEGVVGQQISNKAAATVRNRLFDLVGEITPANILAKQPDDLQKCGMSMVKVNYIRGIAEAATTTIDFANLKNLSDTEIMKQLLPLKGIGEWSVEMLLIFCFARPDVVSFKDLAIRRGIMNLYGHKKLTKEMFEKYRKRYSPYGTVASLYLWALSVE